MMHSDTCDAYNVLQLDAHLIAIHHTACNTLHRNTSHCMQHNTFIAIQYTVCNTLPIRADADIMERSDLVGTFSLQQLELELTVKFSVLQVQGYCLPCLLSDKWQVPVYVLLMGRCSHE